MPKAMPPVSIRSMRMVDRRRRDGGRQDEVGEHSANRGLLINCAAKDTPLSPPRGEGLGVTGYVLHWLRSPQ